MALHGGTPLIYTGQEANWQSRIPIFDHSVIDWTGEEKEGKWIGDLMTLRDSNLALREGTLVDLSTDNVIMFTKAHGKDQALVIVNPRDREASVSVAASLEGSWEEGLTGRSVKIDNSIRIPAYGFGIWVKTVGK